ncbi:MAG TPA: patatin-like phospholipase family protein [Gemmatimonadaceae bacterium]|nr:patatin-like phospholipase family protein [Gemmatimonadaceae bacterium]
MTTRFPSKTAVVLGGGGLKGFAHIGVLRALEEEGVQPALYAGTSIGSLVAAARVSGTSVDELERRARALRRRDLFRLNHVGMLLERMHSPSLYLEQPLRTLCEENIPAGTFESLPVPLLVNTVDLAQGTLVAWGLPGLRDVEVRDAVYASCALPGFFPPGVVNGRVCVDGGTIDNLPVTLAAPDMDLVIAVDVGSSDLSPVEDVASSGFAAIYMRAATVMMHALQTKQLESWRGPPLLLIRPRIADHHWFSFESASEFIAAGYEAARHVLAEFEPVWPQRDLIYPRRRVEITVDDDACIGCTTCVALAPELMAMSRRGKAYPLVPVQEWSPADGEFVQHCPTRAILARDLDSTGRGSTAPAREPTVRTRTPEPAAPRVRAPASATRRKTPVKPRADGDRQASGNGNGGEPARKHDPTHN